MNLLANKELVSLPWLALDCGFTLSWVSFLCQDMICKRFGPKASVKVSILALLVNLAVSALFWLVSLAPGMWGAYYDTGSLDVNAALNATIGGSWYVVAGSSLAMLCSSFVNSHVNQFIGHLTDNGTFATFALRSYVSTGVGQIVDNLVFGHRGLPRVLWLDVAAGHHLLAHGAAAELLCEVVLSPIGFRVASGWARDGVGEEYVREHAAELKARA